MQIELRATIVIAAIPCNLKDFVFKNRLDQIKTRAVILYIAGHYRARANRHAFGQVIASRCHFLYFILDPNKSRI